MRRTGGQAKATLRHRRCGLHLLSREGHHVQGTVHETANQDLRAILGRDDIIHPMVGGDILAMEGKQKRETKAAAGSSAGIAIPTF